MTTLPPSTTPSPPRIVGPIAQRFHRDEDGHRYYEVDFHVRTDNHFDTAAYILDDWPLYAVGMPFDLTPDLPDIEGVDLWAFCTPQLNIAPHPDSGEKAKHQDWLVTQYWSTKQSWRCQTFPIENPLAEPVEISGDFVHENRSASLDRFGKPLLFPNFQPIQGPATEYKYSYPTINITFNSEILPLSTYVLLINKVNDAPLWGLPPRCIRFTDAKWVRKVYGSCFYYYTTSYTFEFDINTFDQEVPVEGTLVYGGSGPLDDPRSFVPAKSDTDENISVPLDYLGRKLVFEKYDENGLASYLYPQHIMKPQIAKEGNLLLLGIPSTLS
jgi:hypothetical protein